jgi:hypothetical protein
MDRPRGLLLKGNTDPAERAKRLRFIGASVVWLFLRLG